MELRKRIGGNFEYAALPSTNQEERGRALHFIVVGGGPTGALQRAEMRISCHIKWSAM